MTEVPGKNRPCAAWGWWWILPLLLTGILLCFVLAIRLGGEMVMDGPAPGGKELPATPAPADVSISQTAVLPAESVLDTLAVFQPSPTVPLDLPVVDKATEYPQPEQPKGTEQPALPPVERISPLEVSPGPEEPLWHRNAIETLVAPAMPKLAIVIDDMGGVGTLTERAMRELPAAVTFAFLPYGPESLHQARRAHAQGHEILVHMPMEPFMHGDTLPDMGPGGLTVGMSSDAMEENLMRSVAPFKDVAVGVNNHMGSRFTAWPDGMRVVLTLLQREGLLFLDSRTSALSAVGPVQRGLNLPVLKRDVFLDHDETPAKIRAEFRKAVELAKKRGVAVVIGHPLPLTLDVLKEELAQLDAKTVALVPLTALVAYPSAN